MCKNRKIAGIYARKSLYTGKGESIQNQVNLCTEFAKSRGWDTIIYTDEGYSGSDTHRPDFQKMLLDIDNGNLSTVIFYRLDRVSRKILDICEFIEQLNSKNVGFISITENFDTTSPMGRAMVHIAATFAQLEREMLAQRIRDNMIQLAKTGRWLGGTTPTGYKSKKIVYINEDLRKKHIYVLEEITEELNIVNEIFYRYLQYKSLAMVERFCYEKGIKSKNNKTFSKVTLRNILTNPVYIKADKSTFDYFNALEVQIANSISDFNGINGLLIYNKNLEQKGQSNKLRNTKDWIMAVGSHTGIISSEDWISVQNILQSKKKCASRDNTSNTALLSGILLCGKCSSQMYVRYGSISINGKNRQSYYVCGCKAALEKNKCLNSNIRTDILDNLVCHILSKNFTSKDEISAKLNSFTERYFKSNILTNNSENTIKEHQLRINNLIQQLETTDPLTPSASLIKEKIDSLYLKIKHIENEINNCVKNEINLSKCNISYLTQALCDFSLAFLKSTDINSKRDYIKEAIAKIIWDNGNLIINYKE